MKLYRGFKKWIIQFELPIFSIFSVHDGPGVRTTVFTKGCNLKCQWCHNPETIQAKPQISYNEELCIGCGMCTQICPEHHRFDVQNGRHIYERKDCKVCEKMC